MKKAIIAVVLVLAAVGVWFARGGLRRDQGSALKLYGNVDIREVNLGFRISGRLAQMLKDEGDEVKTGELLARLDDEPYRRAAEQSRAQVASLRARLEMLQAGNRPQEIAQARAIVREREATAANAQRIFKRQEELFANQTVSVQEREDAEANSQEAEARLNSARQQLSLLEAGFRQEDIAQAKADLARAEAALASAELSVADTALLSPTNGVVLTRAQEPGAILQEGSTVFTVSLKHPVWVRAYVHEPELGKLHPGMKVEVSTDSRPGKSYRGQVGYISPRAEFTPKPVETPELRTSLVYRLRVVVQDPDNELRQGMPVTVAVEAKSAQ